MCRSFDENPYWGVFYNIMAQIRAVTLFPHVMMFPLLMDGNPPCRVLSSGIILGMHGVLDKSVVRAAVMRF
jgi:hypothetical protein